MPPLKRSKKLIVPGIPRPLIWEQLVNLTCCIWGYLQSVVTYRVVASHFVVVNPPGISARVSLRGRWLYMVAARCPGRNRDTTAHWRCNGTLDRGRFPLFGLAADWMCSMRRYHAALVVIRDSAVAADTASTMGVSSPCCDANGGCACWGIVSGMSPLACIAAAIAST